MEVKVLAYEEVTIPLEVKTRKDEWIDNFLTSDGELLALQRCFLPAFGKMPSFEQRPPELNSHSYLKRFYVDFDSIPPFDAKEGTFFIAKEVLNSMNQ
ncbi:uncharacterized protein RSE6_06476 [Rhynchosporium secalis]|uniref:Uncharacterized protein n=1 Tax=Rhynchosporium secalis TaxID=38038 RepID=A0A1E1MAI5_RHYSE|nr:uncharacterized protein RSE6_06476 [Rhynchosporium secalis]